MTAAARPHPGRLLFALIFLTALVSLASRPVHADDHDQRGDDRRGEQRDHDNGRGDHDRRDHDRRYRAQTRYYPQRGYYPQPIYAPPPVYYEPAPSPGISLFFPLDIRHR